jgi:hypothetical protein
MQPQTKISQGPLGHEYYGANYGVYADGLKMNEVAACIAPYARACNVHAACSLGASFAFGVWLSSLL